MEVRGFVFDGASEKIVNADSHVGVSSARIRPMCDVSTGITGGQESRRVRLRGSHLNERTVLVAGIRCSVFSRRDEDKRGGIQKKAGLNSTPGQGRMRPFNSA